VILSAVEGVAGFGRSLGTVLAACIPASLALGLVIGLVKDENVARWLAYGLDIGGAILIGVGFLTGRPSARAKYAHILRGEEPPRGQSRVLLFATAGVLMVVAGTLIELAL
jgi:hypothetical protein